MSSTRPHSDVPASSPTLPEHPPLRPLRDRGRVRAALIANLVCQIGIIMTGGLVRLTGSGLGCPTWPQCTPGSFVPTAQQEQGYHKLIEFGNRTITFVLIAVAVWLIVEVLRHCKDRPGLVKASFVPLIGVLAQGIVGGIIVLTHLDPRTVSPHFLLSILLVAYSTWLLVRFDEGDGPVQATVPAGVRVLAKITAVVGAVVIVLGTAVTGSGPHSGDSAADVRFGFDPRTTSWLHADSVMLFVGLVLGLWAIAKIVPVPMSYAKGWTWVLVLCVVQGLVGYTQYFLALPIALVTVHLLLAAVLTAALTYAVLATRRR